MPSKGFSIVFTEQQFQEVVDRHNRDVAETVLEKLEKKQEELDWIESPNKLRKRFQNFFGENGVQFAEPAFEANNSDYRAILILAGQANSLVFHRAVRKEDYYNSSKQKQIIENLEFNPNHYQKKSLDKILEIREEKDENLVRTGESTKIPP